MSRATLCVRMIPAFALLVGVSLAAGCGSSSSASRSASAAGPGTLSVQLVDAPDPSVESLTVPIDRVEAHVGDAWVVVASNIGPVDLVKYLTTTRPLGDLSLPEGHYSQLRLLLDPGATITMTDVAGTHVLDLQVPSGEETGIKIPLDYTVTAGKKTTILLDFNIAESVVALGNGGYILKPVIHGAETASTGTISGLVTNRGDHGIQRATVTATLPPAPGSTDAPQVFTTLTEADGRFTIWNLPPGTYTVTATWANKTATVNDIVVHAGQDTNVPTIALPN